MRVRVYVDAFNVYYGARSHCGRSVPGWRWLDLAALAMSLINPYVWQEHELERLVYCTAPRDREGDSSSRQDQQTYINALRQHIPKLDIVNGKYVPGTKAGVLVEKARSGDRNGVCLLRAAITFPHGCQPRRSLGPKGGVSCWSR